MVSFLFVFFTGTKIHMFGLLYKCCKEKHINFRVLKEKPFLSCLLYSADKLNANDSLGLNILLEMMQDTIFYGKGE